MIRIYWLRRHNKILRIAKKAQNDCTLHTEGLADNPWLDYAVNRAVAHNRIDD